MGEIQATMPTGEQTIEIITGAKIEEPGFGWRFTHPGELLGLCRNPPARPADVHGFTRCA